MVKYQYLIILIIFSLHYNLPAQNNDLEEINSRFQTAVDLYDSGEFSKAFSIFISIAGESRYNSKTTSSIIFKAKILLYEKSFSEAKRELTSFIERYPASLYIDEARMMLVRLSFDEANYFAAVKEIGFLVDNSISNEDISYAKEIGERISFHYLSSTQLQRLADSFSGAVSKPYFLLLLGRSFLKSNDEYNGQKVLAELMNRYPDSEEYSQAKKLFESPVLYSGAVTASNVILVMLPLQSDEAGNFTSTASIEILEGIKFAISEFNIGRSERIGIVIRDTKADDETIREIRKEFEDNTDVKVILGPLFSNEVRVTLDEFEDSGIPIISPTATDDDLTSYNDNFFQANPSFSQRGKIIARYIYHVENKRKLSILNSIDSYSPLLASSFEDEFKRLGGEILTRETYRSKSFSLETPVSRIAQDSLILEGLYVPLSDNLDAPGILSELIKHKLNLSIFGNQDWFTAKGFETSTELSNKIIFTSDYFIDYGGDDYTSFNAGFVKVTGKDANRNVLYGYDTAKYLLTVMRNIVPSRSSLRSKMVSGITSIGLRNNISFDENRVNNYLNIVRYRDGVFELVEKFKSGN